MGNLWGILNELKKITKTGKRWKWVGYHGGKTTQALIDLQTELLFMEDTVDKLDNIVTEQSQLIADQQRQLQLLYQKLETQTQGSQIQPFDLLSDKPPHYWFGIKFSSVTSRYQSIKNIKYDKYSKIVSYLFSVERIIGIYISMQPAQWENITLISPSNKISYLLGVSQMVLLWVH